MSNWKWRASPGASGSANCVEFSAASAAGEEKSAAQLVCQVTVTESVESRFTKTPLAETSELASAWQSTVGAPVTATVVPSFTVLRCAQPLTGLAS